MKKLAALSSIGLYLLNTAFVFAVGETVNIERPTIQNSPGASAIPVGFSTIGDFIGSAMTLAFIFAVLAVLLMMIWGAFEWITSGGDKENVGKARGKIINALIGLAVLAVAFALFKVAGQFVGIDIKNFVIPSPKN